MQAELAALGRITGLRRLSGGASQETWAFEADGRPLILRRKPPGAAGIPMATEAKLLGAVAANGVPVPEVVLMLDDGYVMTAIAGETLGRRIVRDDAFAGVRPGLARRCGEVLAKIHATPADLPVSDAAAEIAKYEAVYRETGARRPVFDAGFRWLKDRAPPLETPVLVHGDFRNGNLMVHPQRGLAAVLDWELAHLGDPAEDLGWMCVNSWRFGGDKPVGGFGGYEDLLTGYGGGVPLERVLYWQALGSLKWGIMCLMMYASGGDLERTMIGRRASEVEVDLVALLERA